MGELKEKTIQAGDSRVYCLQNTNGSKKDILLLHGAKFSSATWSNLGTLDRLTESGYRVLAVDMPGFGRTPGSKSSPSEVLQGLIENEQLVRPVLIGPSLGGRFCLELYFSSPDKVGGLVLVGTVGVQNFKDRFKEITVPCLLVWGDHDAVSPIKNAYFLDQEIKDSRLVILKEANHPCYLDDPGTWHTELLKFLEEINRG